VATVSSFGIDFHYLYEGEKRVSKENLQVVTSEEELVFDAPKVEPERVSEDHMKVYRAMLTQIQQAETSAHTLRQSLFAMLSQFYSLKQGDQVLETGEIIRVSISNAAPATN
jgi:hypothetical protein